MSVVADASPFIALVKIGRINLMPALFREVLVPPQVTAELAHRRRPQSVRDFIAASPAWLRVRAPRRVEWIAGLDEGELAAISLATELKDGLLLIDEAAGRAVALARQLRITGTVGLLRLAAERRLIDLAAAFEDLKATNFRISAEFLAAELRKFRERNP